MSKTQFHGGSDTVWGVIKRLAGKVGKSAPPIVAAVAWITDENAVTLKKGDVLITELSPDSVRKGAASPDLIATLLERGVRVHHAQGLHAKTALFGETLIVGSMNFSQSSQRKWIEAAIETTDRLAVAEAMHWLEALQKSSPVTKKFLAPLLKIPKPKHPLTLLPGATVHPQTKSRLRATNAYLYCVNGRIPEGPMRDRGDRTMSSAKRSKRFAGFKLDFIQFSLPKSRRLPLAADDLVFIANQGRGRITQFNHPASVWEIERHGGLINVHLCYPLSASRRDLDWSRFKELAQRCGVKGLNSIKERRLPHEAAEAMYETWPARGLPWR
jgi:hypothetical protein